MEFSTQPLTSGNDADVDLEQFIGRRYISPSGYLTDVALRIVLSLGTVETQLEDTTLPFGPGTNPATLTGKLTKALDIKAVSDNMTRPLMSNKVCDVEFVRCHLRYT